VVSLFAISPREEKAAARAEAAAARAATRGEEKAVAGVAANKVAGDLFRDQVASRLGDYGFTVIAKEVTVKTPFGIRVLDILAERGGSLVIFETKTGGARRSASQVAKDAWIARVGVDVFRNGQRVRIPTVVIRG
jgi:hypothetical protein